MAFQEAGNIVVVIGGGSSPLDSCRQLKLLAKEICAIKASAAPTHPFRWFEF
jgi:hypothetical protein